MAFGRRVVAGDVHREGISTITAADIAFAKKLGYVIKLLAVAEEVGGESRQLSVRVHPVMLPGSHPLASVRDAFNAVFIEGRAVGQLMFYGRGAGGQPTASAVLGDIIDAAVNLRKETHGSIGTFSPVVLASIDDLSSEYHLNIEVNDQPGVLAAVANVFGTHNVSIRSMEQEGLGAAARIVFITHIAMERDIQACLGALRNLPSVARIGTVLRVIGPS